ncbi:hypothetical protein FRC11_008792 [Ceratobasidium sp. 423]|nr:hypothetical protein FRC11_008792 [Ceratobasidium sp. 423]
MATSGSPSSARPSSTFWIIDTTSVSDTFTTTATFTLWVPLNTPSTTPATRSSTLSSEPFENSVPHANTSVVTGSAIGSLLGASLIIACIIFYYKRRVRRTIVQPRTKPPVTPSGSEHALLDLTAEPAPHPENIEPWVVPVVQRSTKARDEARRDQARGQDSSRRAEDSAAPQVESSSVGAPRVVWEGSASSPERRTRSNPQVQEAETHDSSATPGSTNHRHDRTLPGPGPSQPRLHLHQPEALATGTKSSAVPRRRAPREPSPPRLEEDAGVSLMRAGDDVLPPSYGDLVHDRVQPGHG